MLKLTLVTPEKKLIIDQEIESVKVPAFKGELTILPGHAPLLTTVEPGVVSYKLKGQDYKFASVGPGYCQVFSEGINILTETAEFPSEVDADRSKKILAEVDKKLATETMTDEDYALTLERREKANARLAVQKLK